MIYAALSPCLHFQNNFKFGSNFWNLPKSTFQIYSNFKNRNPVEYSAPPGLSASTIPSLRVSVATHPTTHALCLHVIGDGSLCPSWMGNRALLFLLFQRRKHVQITPSLPPLSILFVRNRAQIRVRENPPGHNTQELGIALVPPRKTSQQ